MEAFEVAEFYAHMASDEGPPFGREVAGVTAIVADMVRTMTDAIIRWN